MLLLGAVLWFLMGAGIGGCFPFWAELLRRRSLLAGHRPRAQASGSSPYAHTFSLENGIPGLVLGTLFALGWWEYVMRNVPLDRALWVMGCSAIFLLFAVEDHRSQTVPLELAWGVTGLIVITQLVFFRVPFLSLALGMGIPALFFFMQSILSRGRWLGAGDPWVAMMIGAFLAWPLAGVMLYLTYMATIPYLLFVFWRMCAIRGKRVAFVPFLVVGGIGAYWLGPAMLAYLR